MEWCEVKRSIRWILLNAALFVLAGCQPSAQESAVATVQELWPSTVGEYLQEPLWEPGRSYDAAHLLMLPMHCAFDVCPGQFKQRRDEFREFFTRFEPRFSVPLDSNPLREAQFLYLVTQYLVLSSRYTGWQEHHNALYEKSLKAVHHFWNERPAPHWAYSSDFPNAEKRLRWKLAPTRTQQAYFAAIIDEEYYLMALASDLLFVAKQRSYAEDPVLVEIQQLTREVFEQQGRFDSEGQWLMQPGVWRDHKDYRYAGHSALEPRLAPEVREGIGMDVSHSHRFPLWLESFRRASNEQGAEFYSRLMEGFRNQFEAFVLKQPGSAFRWPALANYMDGHNGIYRYGYETLGDELGYGPYELSYALFSGWYAFSGSERLYNAFLWLKNEFPLEAELVRFYLGPDTQRERYPLVEGQAFYKDGFAELLINVSVLVAQDRSRDKVTQ